MYFPQRMTFSVITCCSWLYRVNENHFHSTALKIHISQPTADILVLAGSFELEERGEIEMKVELRCLFECLVCVFNTLRSYYSLSSVRVKDFRRPTGSWTKLGLILLLWPPALHMLTVSNCWKRYTNRRKNCTCETFPDINKTESNDGSMF